MTTYSTTFETGLIGTLTLASDGDLLTGCWFENDRHFAYGVKGKMVPDDSLSAFSPARDWLSRYFAGEKPRISELPHEAGGTEFQRNVWAELERIAYGEVTTYGAIARELEKKLGRPQSNRAVGGAVGRNRLCVFVPCHRVVGADGSLTGFGGGIQTKVKLLELEGVDMSGLYVPTRGTAL